MPHTETVQDGVMEACAVNGAKTGVETRGERVVVFTTDSKPHPLQWLAYTLKTARKNLDADIRKIVYTDDPDAVAAALAKAGLSGVAEVLDARKTIADTGLDAISEMKFHGLPVSPLQVFRLALPLEPTLSQYDRVVFCDTDVSFEDKKWQSIFDIDVSDSDVAAVMDCAVKPRQRMEICRGLWSNPAIAEAAPGAEDRIRNLQYAAAGMMLMNLKRLRERFGDYKAFLGKMIDLCVRHKLPYLDQSLVNLFFDITFISGSYNGWKSSVHRGEEVWMRHYPGPAKTTKWFYPARPYEPQETVDIVYTLGGDVKRNDQELKWSLRSIAKYGRNIGRVIVASPIIRDWMTDDVVQVKCDDLPYMSFKHQDMLWKIINAVNGLDLHGEFLVSSDDHYYVRETDFARTPFCVQRWRLPVEQYKNVMPVETVKWRQSVIDTGKFLVEHDLPCMNFQMHRNAHWHADILRDTIPLFQQANEMQFGCEPHVLMQNIWMATQPGIDIRNVEDVKLKTFHGIEPQWDCISNYESAFDDPGFVMFMNGEFGEKCRYER